MSKVCRGDPCGRPPVALLPLGEIAEQVFEKVEKLYGVEFDCHVIMPNHIHFIVCLPGERATASVWTGKIVYRMFGEMVYSFMIK